MPELICLTAVLNRVNFHYNMKTVMLNDINNNFFRIEFIRTSNHVQKSYTKSDLKLSKKNVEVIIYITE